MLEGDAQTADGKPSAAFDALSDDMGRQLAPAPDVVSDEGLDAWIRATAITVNHPCGTCAIGSGPDAVLHPDLTVRGIEGLRVVDASVFPVVPCANTNFPTLMTAEKISDAILSTGG